jgi:coenzyme F420-reducing hydrogenase gamma subunit
MNYEDQVDLNTRLMETVKQKLEYRRKQQIQFIVSQTNYDEREALEKLEACGNDVVKVVSDYLGITPKEDQNLKKTKNQKVYTVIRDIMDKGSNNYRMQQEKAKKVEEMNELLKRKQAAENSKPCVNNNNCVEKCNDESANLIDCNADTNTCENYGNCTKNMNFIVKEKID